MTGGLTDDEREDHIQACGLLMVAAMSSGNRQAAMDWMQAQTLAIGQRSAAQVARMTAEVERAIDEGVNYFDACGQRQATLSIQGAANGR